MPRLFAPRPEAFAALAKLDAQITASRFYRPVRELISHEGLADSIRLANEHRLRGEG